MANGGIDTTQPTQAKKPRRWMRLSLILLFVLFVLFALTLVAAYVLEDKIKSGIISQINEQITVPVKVEGDISLSLIKHFPHASLTFRNISIDDRLDKNSKKLLRAEEFSFLCNVYSLFSPRLEFTKIVLRNGEIHLHKDANGRTNYEIFKPAKADAGAISLQFNKAQIKNVQFTFADKIQGADASVKLNDVLLNGDFNEDVFLLEVKSKLSVSHIIANRETYLGGKKIIADFVLDVNKKQQKYSFKEGKMVVDENEFSINGFFTLLRESTKLDFRLLSKGKDIQQLFKLIPEQFKTGLANANGNGEYAIEAIVKGEVGKSTRPSIQVKADLVKSEIKLGKLNKMLKNVNATARYESNERGEEKIVIGNFDCTLNSLPFRFSLTVDQFSNPRFNFFANGVLHAEELNAFIPDSILQDLGGTITFKEFHLAGQKSDFSDVENSGLAGSGQFELSEIEFRQSGITYGNINGRLKYENQVVEAQEFTLNFLSTDFNFSGSIQNLFPFVYNLSAKHSANNVVLGINGSVKTNTFNLTGFIDAYDKKNRGSAKPKEKINIREVLNMKGNLEVQIQQFLFKEMRFKNLHTSLQVAPGYIQINHLSAEGMSGEIKSQGLVSFTPQNALNLNLDLTAIDLSIPQILKECENFGQSTLTDNHLKGNISTSVSLDITWKNYKDVDMSSLKAIIDFKIKNGQLIKFEPLRAASKFIKIEELENIRFADLENTIKIANGRIDIPEFEIKTSALNLMFFGFHFFDNRIDYHFKINLHKLLAQRFTRFNQDSQFIEEDPYQGLNIYLSMSGNLSNPVIKYDKPVLRKKIQADFKNEKEVLKNLLKNTPPKIDEQEKKREDKYFDIKEQPQFIDFDNED